MYFEDFTIGQEFNTGLYTITKEEIVAFSKLYDPLPLHLDEEYAKHTRFGGLISSGFLTWMTIWKNMIATYNPFGDEFVAGMNNEVKWILPVYPGDQLRSEINVSNLTPHGQRSGVVGLSMKTINQNGEVVMEGYGEALVSRRD